MAVDLILKAQSIITMDPANPRAEAVAFDSATGTIATVGTLAEVQAANPGVAVTDLGTSTLLPGFIDPHSHPVLGGITTMEPALWIAPYVGYPTYKDVTDLFTKVNASAPAGEPLLFSGLDRTLQGSPELTAADLDVFFPDRPVFIMDNSGHEAYFNTALIQKIGWAEGKPPADPAGAHFGRNDDGTSNGRAYETAALLAAGGWVLANAIAHPLLSSAKWYKMMAQNGITATSEHTFQTNLLPAMTALASMPDSPLRLSYYHMSIDADCGDPIPSPAPESMLKKNGVKLWADGSPWVGTIASTIAYEDNAVTRGAGIIPGVHGEEMMNYTRAQIDAVIDAQASKGWQFAFHCNGDMALDIVLDSYEYGLNKYNLIGTDHRWRVEHVGAGRADQFKRAAELGVGISMSPFQFVYWGDLLDGTLFDSSVGAQWQRFADAVNSGAVVSFHNDGSVSPPLPLLNIQTAVTRTTITGKVHGPEQKISLDDALKAHTVNAAHHLFRDTEIGSIVAGKFADFVELGADPYEVDPTTIAQIEVKGTYRGGKKIDLDAFIAQIESVDPSEHKDLAAAAPHSHNC
jgi:predicted amidohydrolase YtcJ